MERKAVVAGSFYPSNPEALLSNIKGLLKRAGKAEAKSSAVVAPHAGYVYSGQTAAFSFNALKTADTYILLGPNHTGLGTEISVYPEGKWLTPLGSVDVDAGLGGKIVEMVEAAEADEMAHLQEHSLEVQLPFLQAVDSSAFKIVPITIATDDLGSLRRLGEVIAGLGGERKLSVVASSDFSHFVPEENAREKDLEAIEAVKKMDVEGFEGIVAGKRLSICGHVAISVVMEYCRAKGMKRGKLLKYDTSATASGNKSSVVGYASIVFE